MMRAFIAVGIALAVPVVGAGIGSAATGPGVITTFGIPTANSRPHAIAAGPDGNLWFTEWVGNKVGRVTPAGVMTEFPVPTAASDPWRIASGPDGNLWFTEYAANKVAKITTSGQITEYPVPTSGSQPAGITAGPDGNVWFTEYTGNKIGRITPQGDVDEFTIPTSPSLPQAIAAGPDGNLWFTEFNTNKIGRFNPTTEQFAEFSLPTPTRQPQGIAAGPDGNLWFAEQNGNKIGRITPQGTITEFPVVGAQPFDIAAGVDGNLWFTEVMGNKVGRITTAGSITEYPVPPPANSPQGITSGSDGNIWFALDGGNKIGRITTGLELPHPSLSGSGQVGLPLVCGADVWGVTTSPAAVGWQRNGQVIDSTGLVYTPTAADVGAVMTCTSTMELSDVAAPARTTSNPITVVPQVTGPTGAPGANGQDGVVVLAAVFAPGVKTARVGKTLKFQYAVTNAASLEVSLTGKKSATKTVSAKAGTNTVKWKLPKSLKAGKYTLRLSYQGTTKASTKVKLTK